MKNELAITVALFLSVPAMADYLNPCGIIQGGNAWFRIDFGNVSPPDSEIRWLQSGSGSVSFPDGDRGKTVRVHGVDCGDVKLEVQIGGARSRRPCFHARVVTNSFISVSTWVVSSGTVPAITGDDMMTRLAKANEIWKQVGITFLFDDYQVTNRADMLEVGYTSTNGAPTVYDVAALNPDTGRIKVYFINKIKSTNGGYNVNAATLRHGIVISTNSTITTLAHELGHALGLKDIYVSYQGISQDAFGLVEKAKMPDDWNGGTGQRYYRPGTGMESLIPKLIMYGGGGGLRADITIGDVCGLWYSNRWNSAIHRFEKVWQTSLSPIGYFKHGSNVPQYGNEEHQGGNEMKGKRAALAVIAGMGLSVGAETTPPYADEIDLPPELCCNAPECERTDPISDEEALKILEESIQYEHDLGIVDGIFKRMGHDRERMTRVLIHSARDAYDRKYDRWNMVAGRSIGSLSACGTKAAIPFLESVLTNDVYGAGGVAADAYVRLAGDDGRDFAFFKRNFGAGKSVPRDVGKVIYMTIGDRLKGNGLPAAKRKDYIDYLLSRAECENDILTGNMLDKLLVESVPGYRDSERRKSNLQIIQKPTHQSHRIRMTPEGAKVEGSLTPDGERVRKWMSEQRRK